MAHSSEMTWSDAAGRVALSAQSTMAALQAAEEIYQDLFEVYNYTGATDQSMANQLFEVTTADSTQVAKVTDLRLAITALHELYQAMTNVAISQADRTAPLRRMG